MPFCTKEQVSQHSETRICRDKERDMSVFCDVQFKLKNYKCKISIKFTEKLARFYRKLFAIFVAEKVFVGIIRVGLWEDM